MAEITSINPATGSEIASYPVMSDEDLKQKVEQSHEAYLMWKKKSVTDKISLFYDLADHLENQQDSLAQIITEEMGKSYKEAKAEIEKCASVCRYYGENAHEYLGPEMIYTEARDSYVSYQPLGVILGVMPWNFPFWQVFRFVVPTLMAGNTVVVKHASNVTGVSQTIEDIFEKVGFPSDVYQALVAYSSQIENVLRHDKVKGVSLTGSTPAGKAVAAVAGSCMKKAVLELGGSDPYVVLADAPMKDAVSACVKGRFLNAGQSCIAAKRLIVVSDVYDEFKEKLIDKIKSDISHGDPFEDSHHMGPMARKDLRDELHAQVMRSVQAGAQLDLGGEIPATEGAYYPATMLSEVAPGMAAFDEELFGPAVALIKADDEAHAIKLANQTSFGLGAAVFTKNVRRGRYIAERLLEAGVCFVNDFVRSDPRLPFGGINESGYGRELAKNGIREFANVKTIYIK